jgi:hypothetical protein
MTRFVPVTVLVVVMVMVAASGVANADDTAPTGPLATGANITFSELQIHEHNNVKLVFPETDPDSKWRYFNLAHCQCGEPGAMPGADYHEGTFAYLLKLEGANGMAVARPLEIWVGTNCMTDAARPPSTTATCDQLPGLGSVDELTSPGNVRPEIPVFKFMTPTPGAMKCVPAQQSSTLWALVDTNMNNLPDYFASTQLTTDSLPPPPPSAFSASGGDQAVVLNWKPPADASDVYAYQALCARADTNAPGKISGVPAARYMTAFSLCGLASITLTPQDISRAAGAPTPSPVTMANLPVDLQNLEPTFLCGENLSPTATSLRIDGLENGVAYKVALLAIDKFQNAVGVYFTSTVTPVPSTDFWEDLHDPERGSNAQGGLCLLAEAYGDDSSLTGALRSFRDDTLGGSRAGRWLISVYYATLAKLGATVHGSVALRVVAAVVLAPVVVFALLWHCLTLPGVLGLIIATWLWRRRRGFVSRWVRRLLQTRAAHVAAGVAMIALCAGRADAGGYQPYWENSSINSDENQSLADEPGLVAWHVGVRLGPYVPEIDDQAGGMPPGPYEQMFGGYHMLTMLDVDRILWSGFGQVGVGLSLGYWQKTARTFTDGSEGMTPRPRASDVNKFRLIPMELTATYRFTQLDDDYGIPVVPYIRGGLAYYLWWISTPSGYARACTDGGMKPTCNQTKALGASLGVRGAIGLSIRAERIDPSAAMSMRQSGLQHAGVFGELSIAKVDGFGSDTKLSVGDRTWFAGVDFEF